MQIWCLKHLEIIGEAAARLTEATRAQNPTIPWRQIVGMRNILIHGYFDVNWNQVWNVVSFPRPGQALLLEPHVAPVQKDSSFTRDAHGMPPEKQSC